MNNAAFFDAMRKHFGGRLSDYQVQGMSALLLAGADLPLQHMANVLAQVRRETGDHMAPIKETVMPYHKDKNPSDATVIARLDKAWKAGKLRGVKEPYWRDGWFGRSQIQLSHRRNYERMGLAIGVDLLRNPQLALNLDVSAKIAVTGMRDGMFTGKRLSDYRFPEAVDNPAATNPRRIVNGPDGSDKEVARFHRQFAAALEAARFGREAPAQPQPQEDPLPQSEPAKPSKSSLAALMLLTVAGLVSTLHGCISP